MSNNQDDSKEDLSALWQMQQTNALDVKTIASKVRSQRCKQRVYLALDFLSLIPFVLYFYLDLNLPMPIHMFVIAMGILSLITIFYFAKLRWVSAFSTMQSTENFLDVLLVQLKNNAIIARINKHFGWIVMIAVIAIHLLMGVLGYRAMESAIKTAMMSFVVCAVLLVPFTIWAHKRQRRFERELKELELQLERQN